MVDRIEPTVSSSAAPAAHDVFGLTHRGKVRPLNEDQFLVGALRKSMRILHTSVNAPALLARCGDSSAHLLVVADGLGGMGGGELASGTAVEMIARQVSETIGCYFTYDVESEHEFLDKLEEAVDRAHEEVVARYASATRRPATTVTLAAVTWPRAYIVHVGDSRAYYLRAGRLRQLTRDQTVYEEMVDAGTLQEDPSDRPGARNRLKDVLTGAVGYQLAPAISLVDLVPGDALLLCTDGLTKHVRDEEMAGILAESASAEAACGRLLGLALDRGGSDNITIIVARFPRA